MTLNVIFWILIIQLIMALILIYICGDYGIDHMPIYYIWKYIWKQPSPTIRGTMFILTIFTIPIDIYFWIFKWIFRFIEYIGDKIGDGK